LIAFARDRAELSKKVEGVTVMEHLRGIEERTGKTPARLRDAPKCPPGLAYLWATFIRLRKRCTPSMSEARILYTDMQAFMHVTGERLTAWEAELIERLDDTFAEVVNAN